MGCRELRVPALGTAVVVAVVHVVGMCALYLEWNTNDRNQYKRLESKRL